MRVEKIKSREIITKSKLPATDFVINPYIGCTHKCVYCYAEYMKKFSNHKDEEWCSFLDVKEFDQIKFKNIYKNKNILISSVTDPYNGYEAKVKKTREILTSLIKFDSKIEILTKSPLVLRDIDLLKQMKNNVTVGISIAFSNDNLRKIFEPNAPTIESRIETLRQLKKEGIKTYVFISPIFPHLTNINEIIDLLKTDVDFFMFENLNLRGSYKNKVLELIKKNYPKYLNDYVQIFNKKDYKYWDTLLFEINKKEINKKVFFYHSKIKKL